MRIKFLKGQQRKFFDLVIESLKSPSLRGLLQFGLNINYSTLKNYYSETRLLPEEIFRNLLNLSGLKSEIFRFEILSENWGKIKGGKKSKRKS